MATERLLSRPRTHIGGAPFDHKPFKGDWLLYRRIEQGRTVFVGTFEARG